MSYFIRVTIIYFVLFVGISIGIERAFFYYHHTDNGHASINNHISLSDAIAQYNPNSMVRETGSGLFLAGTVARYRQDWTKSWDFFSRLDAKIGHKNETDINLKSMNLALVNGDFDKAGKIASDLLTTEDINDNTVKQDQFSLLFLAVKDIRDGNYKRAQDSLDVMKDGAIYALVGPVIQSWIAAVQEDKNNLPKKTKKLNSLHAYYYALALEYLNDTKASIAMMDRVEMRRVPLNKIENIIAFYYRVGKTNKAIETVKKASNIFPTHAAFINILDVLENTPDIYEPPHNADYHMQGILQVLSMAFYDFSNGLLNEKIMDGALLTARMGQYLNPEYQSTIIVIADIFAFHKQDDRAIEWYETITDEVLKEEALAAQIDIYSKNKDYKSARRVIEEAIKQSPDNAYFYYLAGNIYRDLRDYEKSISYFNMAEEKGRAQNNGELPKDLWPLFYGRAISYDLDDQWNLAEADLKMAMEKIPNNPLILNYIGYAYADRNVHLDKAKDYIAQAVLVAPNDPYIIDSMGWILYRIGEYDEALKYLERAALMRPYHMVINDHLGDVYWQQGRKIEAHYMWKRAATYYDDQDEEQQRMIDKTYQKLRQGL